MQLQASHCPMCYYRYVPFTQYMLVILAVLLMQLVLLGYIISFGRSLRNKKLLFWYRLVLSVTIFLLVVFSALVLAYVAPAEDDDIEP